MTRWIELRGVHVDADAVVSVERQELHKTLLLLSSGSGVVVSLFPRDDETYTEITVQYPPYPQIERQYKRRWFRPVLKPLTADESALKSQYDTDHRAWQRAYEVAQAEFADARHAEIVAAITGAAS